MGLSKISKQYNLGARIGSLKEIAMHTAFYVSVINFGLLAVTAYNTTLRDPMQELMPWMNFPIFIAVLLAIVWAAMLFEYKFIYPAIWAFRNEQQYKHSFPIRRDIKEVMEKLEEMDKEIKELKK